MTEKKIPKSTSRHSILNNAENGIKVPKSQRKIPHYQDDTPSITDPTILKVGEKDPFRIINHETSLSKPVAKNRKTLKILIIVFSVLLAVLLAILLFGGGKLWASPVNEYAKIEITKGMNAKQVASLLKDSLVIDNSHSFIKELEKRNLASSIQSGVFILPKNCPISECIDKITTVTISDTVKVTVFAGQTIKDIDQALVLRGYAKESDFIQVADKVSQAWNLNFAEGWLLSGEYEIQRENAAENLAMKMLEAMLAFLQTKYEEISASGRSIETLLIVSSMVERETNNLEEMPVIASIIFNRLDASMPLGIDATTRYELDNWTGEITQKEYDKITPYNTRRKIGLPPSGIGCPSKEAISATLAQEETDFFYYRHDKQKNIHYSVTYEEHLENAKINP